MAGPTTYASVKQGFGIAKEATPGTPVAMTATLPLTSLDVEDKVTYLDDKAYRAVMGNDAFNEIQGVKSSDLTLAGQVYGDTIGYLLMNLMGECVTTGTEAPYTNSFALLNSGSGQPGSHTLTHVYGPTPTTGARYYPGLAVGSMEFTFNAASGLLTHSTKATGWPSTPVTGSAPVIAPTAVKPTAAWEGTLSVAGSAVANLVEGTITITRETEIVYTVNDAQVPYIIQRGGLSATFSLTFVANDETDLNYMLNNTQPALLLSLSTADPSAPWTLAFQMSQGAFITAKPTFGAKAVEFATTGKAVFNSTDVNASGSGGLAPVLVTLTNGVDGSTTY